LTLCVDTRSEITLRRVETGEARLRVGHSALRRLTLANYEGQCAVCDTRDPLLLVTSHVARWTDRPDARGKLSNTICFCAMHDRLFEHGYFGIQDDLRRLIVRSQFCGGAIRTWLGQCTTEFQCPTRHPPMVEFLREHRSRVGLSPGVQTD
jgi:predicted restriction endonuclease